MGKDEWKKYRQFTREDDAKIIALRAQGVLWREIGAQLTPARGIHQVIYRYWRLAELKRIGLGLNGQPEDSGNR
ncbi:hypothetical protein LTR85_004077 [Meristemomyces frigidus]|nr:hypothetical protein LTR85_004077 [Meristemomyces frigidus]